MPVRTINYTGRKHLRHEDARITLREDKDGHAFDASLHLEKYDLPDGSRVYVEAYRQTRYMRFDFGRIGAIHDPDDRHLTDLDSIDGVLFRVKVVTDFDPHGLLLAEADQIRPKRSTDSDENQIPLLPVVSDSNMGEEIWRLVFEDQQTVVKINSGLGDWRAIARDPVFVSLVYPCVFRIVLERILSQQEKDYEPEDMDDWRSRWIRFATNLPGVSDPPGDIEDEASIEGWIDNAVLAFCRRQGKGIRTIFHESYWAGAQGNDTKTT
jgi:YD repeat-containing protein